ncbi:MULTISPECIES: sce7726 family protein [Massilia]|jgi:hypothetical protein|uniref:sce7726 family protein n=1 Tax=Massilia TaxID=149698 RepID=UPI001C6319C4|nr:MULTISPECIES: sce7726 family protein [Massilia]QYG00020.1 sce7726 family protein [Massilia sp. NP310]
MGSTINSNQLAYAAKLFSPVILQEMGQYGQSPSFCRLANESGLLDKAEYIDVRDFFDAAFLALRKKSNRYEYIYKSAIAHKVLLGVHSLKTASMLSEFRVGMSKADMVILNGTSTVYEIKTERDNLDRLPGQISDYRKVFAKINVICAENHIDAVEQCVDSSVGILVLNDRHKITTIREALDRKKFIDPRAVFDSIHKNEALLILDKMGVAHPKVPNTQFHREMTGIFSSIDPSSLHKCMIEVIKETRSRHALAESLKALPKSLYMAAFSTTLRPSEYKNLIKALSTPLSVALAWA